MTKPDLHTAHDYRYRIISVDHAAVGVSGWAIIVNEDDPAYTRCNEMNKSFRVKKPRQLYWNQDKELSDMPAKRDPLRWRVWEAGKIAPPTKKKFPSQTERVYQHALVACRRIVDMEISAQESGTRCRVVMECPTDKIHRSGEGGEKLTGRGASILGSGLGSLYTLLRHSPGCIPFPVKPEEWIGGRGKPLRKTIAAKYLATYDAKDDTGADIADAMIIGIEAVLNGWLD